MNFTSITYIIFLILVFLIYQHISRLKQNLFLIVVSCVFYAYWDYRFLGLIFVSIVISYVSGHFIYHEKNKSIRRNWLLLSVVVNLGLLAYFKYANFFIESFQPIASAAGWYTSDFVLRITLPIGISFYTFQSLTYPLDLYSRKLNKTSSFINFTAFVVFFPKLIAGPICRAREFIFQLEEKRDFQWEDFQEGCIRFLTGFFKKTFIADTLSIYLVTPVFSDPGSYSTEVLWLAMFGYAVQIYADFSGYSNMAIGSARILGFRINENFLFPYLSTNFSDFWRRWHITMSTFFRDYIYILLGGNRCGQVRKSLNLLFTMFVCGLWHGSAWTFVCWGGLHGLFLIVNHTIEKKENFVVGKQNQFKYLHIFCAWGVTQLFVCLAWVLFRIKDFKTAIVYYKGLVGFGGIEKIIIEPLVFWALLAFIADHLYGWLSENRAGMSERAPIFIRAFVYAMMIVIIYNCLPKEGSPFIYFQF